VIKLVKAGSNMPNRLVTMLLFVVFKGKLNFWGVISNLLAR
jgi:hypothetical protein